MSGISDVTEYAAFKRENGKQNSGTPSGWERSTGINNKNATVGSSNSGLDINAEAYVSPAMWVKLSSDIMKCEANYTYLTFGDYEQDNELVNGKEPIEWLVLAQEGNKTLLISRYILDYLVYDYWTTDRFWETGPVRAWLNSTFINAAFDTEEREKIALSDVKLLKSNSDSVSDSYCVQDYIFLLSDSEKNEYFYPEWTAYCKATPYATVRDNWKISDLDDWTTRRVSAEKTSSEKRYEEIFDRNTKTIDRWLLRPAMWVILED